MLVWGRLLGARTLKTGLAVSLACGLWSLVDITNGLVGAGTCAALMIAPDSQVGRHWARNQFAAALIGVLVGAVSAYLFGWAPMLTGPVAITLILVYTRMGVPGAIIPGLSNSLFIMEHSQDGATYAFYRLMASLLGLVIGWAVNRYVLPRDRRRQITPVEQLEPTEDRQASAV